MPPRVFAHSRPGLPVAIIYLAIDTPAREARALAKTLFELHRSELSDPARPALAGDDLVKWQMNVHFDQFTGPQPWQAREITGEVIPVDRTRRHAWRDIRGSIIVDATVP